MHDAPTLRYPSRTNRVLIVHDNPRPCFALADQLQSSYVVRIAHSLADIGEHLGIVERLACLVCITGGGLRARDVRDQAIHLGVRPERILFVEPVELATGGAERIRAAIDSLEARPRFAAG